MAGWSRRSLLPFSGHISHVSMKTNVEKARTGIGIIIHSSHCKRSGVTKSYSYIIGILDRNIPSFFLDLLDNRLLISTL